MAFIKRFLPIIILLIALGLFFALDGEKYLTLATIKQHYHNMLMFSQQHFWLSSIAFILAYICITALSIPAAATLMTFVGGALFGLFPGGLWILLGATFGSCIVFLAVRIAFNNGSSDSKNNKYVERLREGFNDNAFNYLMVLRLVPIFPFFAINIACGALEVRLSTYFWATLIGMIPGTLIYTWVGTGLGFAINQGKDLNLGIIFEPQFIYPIIGLAILSIIPTLYKKIKGKTSKIG